MQAPQPIAPVFRPVFRKGPQQADCLQLFIFEGAPTEFAIDFRRQHLKSGDIAILPAGHWFGLAQADCPTCLCVEVEEALLEPRFLRLLRGVEYVPQKVLPAIDPTTGFYQKLQAGQPPESWLPLFTAEVETRVKAIGAVRTPRRHGELAATFRQQLITDLEGGLQRNLSAMAADLGVSEGTLKRACKACFRCWPQEVQKVHKLLHSLALLGQPKTSMTAVAQAVGYNGHTAFSRFIKEETGRCPTELKRMLLQAPPQ